MDLATSEVVDHAFLFIPAEEMVLAALKHIDFLKGMHRLSLTLKKPTRDSLDRYVNYWLPLVAKESDKGTPLIPPADVAWLWHCHRLAPGHYQAYVETHFHKLVESCDYAFEFQEPTEDRHQAKVTRDIWAAQYPGRAFFPSDCQPDAPPNDPFLLGEFDLLACAERQPTFLWQVSGDRFSDTEFLMDGVKNYVRFLLLFRQQGSQSSTLPLVPTFQIDLIWHTHMLKSMQAYNEDCIRIVGHRLHHDDSLNDRTEGSKLNISFENTSRRWKETFGLDYSVPGGMYRGEPPQHFWDPTWQYSSHHEKIDVFGVLAGSFSAGKIVKRPPPPIWLIASESARTFIPARPRSKNEPKINFIFGFPRGIPNCGVGYYHMHTKEGWTILVQRLGSRVGYARQDMESFLCRQCACGRSSLTGRELREYQRLEIRAKQLEDLLYFALAQRETRGPGDVLSPAIVAKYKLDQREKLTPDRVWNDNSDATVDNPYTGLIFSDFVAAAGCGGGLGAAGGGCGGGGCGGGGD